MGRDSLGSDHLPDPALASVTKQDRPSLGHAKAAALPTSGNYRDILIKHAVVLQLTGVTCTFLSPSFSRASTGDLSQLKTHGKRDW